MQDRIAELLEKQSIIEVGLRYASAVDTRDIDRFLSCFTPDARWYSDVHDARGHQEIAEAMQRAATHLDAAQHVATNFEVTLDGDRATMRSCYIATHVKAPLEPYVLAGAYDDELVKTADGWRIRSRKLTIQWTSGDPAVMTGITR